MPILRNSEIDSLAVNAVAELMAASARTAPKGGGLDNISTAVITGNEKDELADAMERRQEKKRTPTGIFARDAEGVRKSQAVLLLGVRGTMPKRTSKGEPLNCGACGYETCGDFDHAEKKEGLDFIGPNCIFKSLDLGIALGSAAKTASILNVDSRIMYRIGTAARRLKLMTEASVIMGIPISAKGKSIYFDRAPK